MQKNQNPAISVPSCPTLYSGGNNKGMRIHATCASIAPIHTTIRCLRFIIIHTAQKILPLTRGYNLPMRLGLCFGVLLIGVIAGYAQMAQLEWQIKPGVEGGVWSGGANTKLVNDRRAVNPNGRAVYSFRLLSGMDVQLKMAIGGTGKLRVLSGKTGLLYQTISGGVQNRAYSFRVPPAPPVQSVQVILETGKGAGLALYAIELKASDRDEDRDGIGDAVERMLGAQAGTLKPLKPVNPATTFQTGAAYEPRLDLQTDAVIVYSDDPARIEGWRQAGYIVQTMGGFRDYTPYAEANPGSVQTRKNGEPMQIQGSFYLAPTEDRKQKQLNYYQRAVASGSQAVIPEEPEYWAQAGYEEFFKTAWRQAYGTEWQPPHESIVTRWQADRLKANLMTQMVHEILSDTQQRSPNVRRMTAVHSPLNYALWAICFAHHQALLNPLVQEVIGQVWSDTVRVPVLSDGAWKTESFAMAYLEYASLVGLLRDTGKTLWFLMDPLSDVPDLDVNLLKRYYADTLAAAALFPEVTRYEVLPWPERIFGRVPAEYAGTILSAIRALEQIAQQSAQPLDAGSPEIGIIFSDSMVFQRGEPEPSHLEDFFGLAIPLVKAGVPLQVLSLERVTEPGYLRRVKVILLSYDYQKPLSPAVHDALVQWVQNGGWLLTTGGTDAYNDAPGWWRDTGVNSSPLKDLMSKMGLQVTTRSVPPETAPENAWKLVAQHGTEPQRNINNRRWVTIDLNPYARTNETVYIRFHDTLPDTGWGPLVRQVRLEGDGRTLAAFYAGTAAEQIFMYTDDGSRLSDQGRFADGHAAFIYRIPLQKVNNATLNIEIAQEWSLSLSTVPPFNERIVTPNRNDLPRVRMREDEIITLCNLNGGEVIYTFDGQPAGAAKQIGRGGMMLVGIPGRAFGHDPGGADKVRTLVRHIAGRAGLRYRERSRFLLKRGDWHIAYGTLRQTTLRGTYLDVLDPRLTIARDLQLMPGMPRVLLNVENSLKGLKLLHTNARVILSNNSASELNYLLKGPAGTPGVARVATGGKRPKVEAFDPNGSPVPINIDMEGSSMLIRWNMNPQGTLLLIKL